MPQVHDGVYTWLGLMWVDETDLTALLGYHTVERLPVPLRWALCYSLTRA